MTNKGLLPTLRLLALSAILTMPAATARAQSESDLRRQNQELAARARDLEAELEAARRQNDALQKRIAVLEAQLAAAARTPGSGAIAPLEQEQVSIDESKPGASPRASFNAVVESYQQAVGNSPIGTLGDRDRVAYMRKLEKWEPAAEREVRMPIEWHVRVLEPRMVSAGRERFATFIAVDPVTDARLGDPFDVALPRALATRLAELVSRGDPGVLVLKGTLLGNIIINPHRQVRGSFDNPRFIGPFSEFEFTVDPSSLVPAKPAATQPATQAHP